MSYYKDREAEILPDLDRHLATFSKEGDIACLKVEAPDSSFYRMHYQMHRGTMQVTGDLGYAIYQFSQNYGLEDAAACGLEYFASKCVASENGRGHEKWDRDRALEVLKQVIADHDESGTPMPGLKRMLGSLVKGLRGQFDKHNWDYELQELYANHPSEIDDVSFVGYVVSRRCQAHLLGLKKAFNKLDND